MSPTQSASLSASCCPPYTSVSNPSLLKEFASSLKGSKCESIVLIQYSHSSTCVVFRHRLQCKCIHGLQKKDRFLEQSFVLSNLKFPLTQCSERDPFTPLQSHAISLGTISSCISQNILFGCSLLNLWIRKLTTSFAHFNCQPFGFSFSCVKALLMIAPTPSLSPLPWLDAKKFHIISLNSTCHKKEKSCISMI